ncbi:hypothetical protein DFH06DRAFT_206431 [Mycena polygramma]|nr:hypothetical protein DFH06DRAFT_206431 [Mycena polygramma]
MSKSSQPLLMSVPAGANPPPYYQPVAYQAVPVQVEVHPYGYRRSPARRFFVAFFVAVGIYAAFKTLTVHHRHHRYRNPWGDRWEIPSDLLVEDCVSGSDWTISDAVETSSHGRNSERASFEIPLKPETVLLLSRYGSSSPSSSLSGSLAVTTSTHLNNTAKITVNSFHDTDNLENVKVCLVTEADGKTGLGIFGKHSWIGRRAATFIKINVALPRSENPLQLKGIVANLPHFFLNIGNLTDAVHFHSASFRTSNAGVKVKSLTADHATLHTSNAAIIANSLFSSDLDLRTSNGPISGTYNSSGRLHLTTSNALISVTVGLEGKNHTRPTLLMRTSNARLDAKVTLFTKADKGGEYRVTGITSNGPLAITLPGSPVGSALELEARTSNKEAEVRLHGAYEGAFAVATSNFAPAVKRVDEDGDERNVDYESRAGRQVRGHVYLKERNRERGRVKLTTSNAPAVLYV